MERRHLPLRRRHPNSKELAVALSNDADHGYRPHCIDPKTKAFVPMPDAGGSRPNEGADKA
jgi:hypothetical protein